MKPRSLRLPLLLSVVWLAAFAGARLWLGSFYVGVGASSLVVLALYGRDALHIEARTDLGMDVIVGLLCGAIGVLLAHAGFLALGALWPALADDVASVYAAGAPGPLELYLVTPVVVVAEEVLWRQALLEALELRMPALPAAAVSVLVYGVAQGGAGSPAVVLAALALGAGMVALKKLRGGLAAPLAAHLVFTMGVLAVFPISG